MAFTETEKANIKKLKGYRQIQTALQYIIAKTPSVGVTLDEYNDYKKLFVVDKNLVQGHYRAIQHHNESITLTPGSISRELFGERQLTVEWPVNIELFMVQTKDKLEDFYEHLSDVRDNMLETLDLYPTMGFLVPGIVNMFTGSADEPEWAQISRHYVWTQRFECTVQQHLSIPLKGDWNF